MSALTEILKKHVPYASRYRDNVMCLACMDSETGGAHGEFLDTDAWARHVEQEFLASGLRVVRVKQDKPEQLGLV